MLERKEPELAIYLAKRLLGACVVLWAIITITFGLMHAIPGGPFTQEKKLPLLSVYDEEEKQQLLDAEPPEKRRSDLRVVGSGRWQK